MNDIKKETLYIAGHRGLVGGALTRQAKARGYTNIVTKTHRELDLTDQARVFEFFEQVKPKYVMLSAAKVGGIHGNNTYPVEFMLENLKIQNNIIEASYKFNVTKLMFFGSSCIYPKEAPQPLKEDYLLSGKLEPTNEPYALAKIAGIKLCDAYNRQYKTNFISVMPCNLYGYGDNYHPENAHALPMLLRRFHESKQSGKASVAVWGSGKPRREFLFADDLADACFFILENFNADQIGEFINIGSGTDVAISELVEIIKSVVGFNGKIELDSSKPDGTFRKLMDVTRLNKLGWKAKTSLEEGVKLTYQDFLNNPEIRK